MSVVHIPEEEARADFGVVLSKYDAGDKIVIDRSEGQILLVDASLPRALTFEEAIARLPKDSIGIADEDFAHDVQHFRKRHSESLTSSSKWD